MSEKQAKDTDATSKGKTSLLEMQDQGMKKKKSAIDKKSDKLDDDFLEHRISSEEDEADALIDESLAKLPAIEQFKKMREKTSFYGSSSWYDRLFFGWVFKIIEMAQTKSLRLEDMGGMRDEDLIQNKIKKVEEVFAAQPKDNKNIFLALMQAFKDRYIFSFVGVVTQTLLHMTFPICITKIVNFMEDKSRTDFDYGIKMLSLLIFLNILMYLIDVHTWYNNLTTGCMSNKIITAMTVKKQLKLNAATSKNYEAGQIHSVRGASNRLVHFCWEFSHFVTTPIWIVYCTSRLFMAIGPTFLVGLSLMVVCSRFDKYYRKLLSDENHEAGKLEEKRMNLTSESFENIKTIKFYGWDVYFNKEIRKIKDQQIVKQQKIQGYNLVLSFVWNFLPQLMSTISVSIFIGVGNTLSLAEAMEIFLLFNWIRGAFNHLLNMQDQLVDLRLCIRRIQEYLGQDEVSVDTIINRKNKSQSNEYSIKIENQSFSWGLQTQDIDDLFDKMNREMKGLTEDQKTVTRLREELEKKQKKEAELKKQRKLDNIVCLKEIDIKIKKGSFVCIIGKVGSGKSSLLSALIGDLLPVPEKILKSYMGKEGLDKELNQQEAESFQADLIHYHNANQDKKTVEVNGTIAYTQQTPWIRNRIVRENIVYNMPFNLEKYVDCVQYCELEKDFESLKAGDQTEIGEKGVNLSGGQKARLGLARAVYQDKEIYLMDDPISALDAHVRKQIINNVYFGVLQDRTRILVTHAIDFLAQADHIIMMDQGKIQCQGTYDDLMLVKDFQELMDMNKINQTMKKQKTMSKMASTMSDGMTKQKSIFEENQESMGIKTNDDGNKQTHLNNARHEHEDGYDCHSCGSCDSLSQIQSESEDSEEMADDYDPLTAGKTGDQLEKLASKMTSTMSLKKTKTIVFPIKATLADKKKKLIEYGTINDKDEGKIIDDEAEDDASIEWKTVNKLIEYYGHWSQAALLVVLSGVLIYLRNLSGYQIGKFAEDTALQNNSSKYRAQVIKMMTIVLVQALTQIMHERLFRLMIDKTLKQVHHDLLDRIMKAPVNLFFDITPNGTIMKRFSEDIGVVEHIVRMAMHCTFISFEIMTMFYMVCNQSIYAIIIIPMLFGYAKSVWDYTLKAKRQACTMLSNQGRPITTHQGEIMSGTSTIRALGTEEHAVDIDAENQNAHLLVQQVQFASFTWYSIRLMMAACITSFLAGVMCIYSKFNGADPILCAMALQQVVHLGFQLNGLVHISGDFEQRMAAIQKCFKLLEIPQENRDQERTDSNWPTQGKLEFDKVELKYRPSTDLVLKKLNLKVEGGLKVGVVGRTGAGKSTLTLALTRIIEICGGTIKIDDVDINKISLQQVREAITIIPQEPCLFKGSLRFNLDPTEKNSDEDCLELLKEAGLLELILKKKKEEMEKKKKLDESLSPEELAKAKADKQEEDDSLLNFQISSGGENLSSGEKSLICIARAILRKNKIVILDEATANIDIVTEKKIQALIKKSFKDCTMIVVAHRLQTIIDSDKVLVLDKGRTAEFDSPTELQKNPNSHFTKLLNEIRTQEEEKKAEDEKKKKSEIETKKEDKE